MKRRRSTGLVTSAWRGDQGLRSVETGSGRRFDSEIDVLARLDHPGW